MIDDRSRARLSVLRPLSSVILLLVDRKPRDQLLDLLAHGSFDRRIGIDALVGKGITFDSGGLSLKPPAGMMHMKADMGGAAAVISATLAAAELGLPVNVTGWVAATENMPSGTAIHPGDVLVARNGKSIEVLTLTPKVA